MINTRYNYTFDPKRIYPHELAALGRGAVDGFFPTTFIFDTEGITAIYDCDGYSPLSGFRLEQTSDVMYILEKILLILKRCPEHLLVPERVLTIPETVFYRVDTGSVRMTYIPVSGEADVHRNLIQFLIRICVDLCDPFGSYIDRFIEKSREENLDIESMLTLVGVLRRELDEQLAGI